MDRISLAKRGTVSAFQDEASTVELAKHNPEAFGILYRHYVTRVYRYLFNHVGDSGEAEDLTAQVFSSALEGLGRYREQGNFAAWLIGIARHKVSDHFRHRKDHLSMEEIGENLGGSTDPLGNIEHEENLKRLSDLVARLTSEQKEMLRLRYAAEMSYQQIGVSLGKSEAAVKMAMHRLIRQLQADWEQEDE
jgi:RNA polymerase sigma-70 factor (ECF subfamily)